MGSIIGLDVGIQTCDVCGINESGSVVRRCKAATRVDTLIGAVTKFSEPRVAVFEESSQAQWMADILRPHAKVVVVDARHNRLISEATTKSDPLDAHRLAELYRLGAVREVYHSADAKQVEYKRLVQQYEDLTREVIKAKNKIKAIYRQYGCRPRSTEVFHQERRDETIRCLPEPGQQRTNRWYAILDKLVEVQQETRKGIMKCSIPMEEYQRLRGIPGVGPITASEFIAYLQTPERFRHPNQVWAYARLAVIDRSSAGKKLGRPHLSPQGNGVLKAATQRVFMGAMMKSRGLNAIAEYYLRCRQRGMNPVHARLTTQRKILTIVWTIWRKREAFDPRKILERV